MTTLRELDGTYTIDPTHSRIGFSTPHAMVTTVRGSFNDVEGTAATGPDLAGAQVQLTIQAASIDTRNADRDGHLRSGDFFDVETHPTLTFRSTEVTALDEDTLQPHPAAQLAGGRCGRGAVRDGPTGPGGGSGPLVVPAGTALGGLVGRATHVVSWGGDTLLRCSLAPGSGPGPGPAAG